MIFKQTRLSIHGVGEIKQSEPWHWMFIKFQAISSAHARTRTYGMYVLAASWRGCRSCGHSRCCVQWRKFRKMLQNDGCLMGVRVANQSPSQNRGVQPFRSVLRNLLCVCIWCVVWLWGEPADQFAIHPPPYVNMVRTLSARWMLMHKYVLCLPASILFREHGIKVWCAWHFLHTPLCHLVVSCEIKLL